ncbi:hypothetical protein AS9A_3067 [Hoyosella subflava DQS3-9A1]|uniref:Uncharacterized protein n=1 Tax=Hoyosella subflava (strain DSM 45089 / JCM 17490 / NBRC 109087 / DQS3-9A1) TaxID=443218 RepID=F6ELR4_HOYSD|nr:hypothetical protein AS9A_3067 [Hoyosella subflava DQS3-9A1]
MLSSSPRDQRIRAGTSPTYRDVAIDKSSKEPTMRRESRLITPP